MRSAVAGTFNVLHEGHRALIDRAFEIGDDVFVGITSDEMASSSRETVNPVNIRRAALTEYLSSKERPWIVFEIDDMYGPREFMDAVDVLVVSAETEGNGEALNTERASRGVTPMLLDVVGLVACPDGSKISSTGIVSGLYGRDGDPDVIDIAVGSTNRIKVEAVRSVMERIYGDVRITAVDVSSGVPDQPFEEQTRIGAENRARAALGEHDMAVGIEAGVFEKEDGLYDVQHCVVIDSSGGLTAGMGSGFRYPDAVAALVRGGLTVGQAMLEIYGRSDIGHQEGAVGLLSKGLLDRKTLTEQSVTAAMIPRIWDE